MEFTKRTDFRIGNLVADENGIYKIDDEHLDEECFKILQCWGIPLTDEWLLKFGFKKGEKSRYGNKYTIGVADWGFTIENSFEKGKWFFGHEYYDSTNEAENYQSMHFCYDLKFVHQLQNIYFSLTFSELECAGF